MCTNYYVGHTLPVEELILWKTSCCVPEGVSGSKHLRLKQKLLLEGQLELVWWVLSCRKAVHLGLPRLGDAFSAESGHHSSAA